MASANGSNAQLMEKVNKASNVTSKQQNDIKGLLADVNIKKRFEDVLGKNAPAFISSMISVTNGNKDLKAISFTNPMSIISAGAISAALNLPIDPNLGFAYIVPYGGKATFQMGYKGFIQLAMRSGQYKTINASEVYEGEIKEINRFTGDIEFGAKESENVVGYMAYFKLINGFEKYWYMTTDQVKKHAKSYSKSFNNSQGRWKLDFHAMAIKTVLKLLLSKYGILSIDMQGGLGTALQADQAVVHDDGNGTPTFDYVDTEAEPVNEDEKKIDPETGEILSTEPTPESHQQVLEHGDTGEEIPFGPRPGESQLEYDRRMRARVK